MKQKENASKQSETSTISYYLNKPYLNNIILLSTLIGKYTFENLVTDQLAHTKRAGVERI